MDAQLIPLFLVVGGMVLLFVSNVIPVDLTSVAGLLILTLLGYISADQAFIGFSSPAVITMLSTFFLGAALRKTGVGATVAGYIHRVVGNNEMLTVGAVMLLGAVLSAFMNNVAAVAVLFPAVVSLAHRCEIPPSRVLIPLAYGTVLGGTTTVIGTAPNIIIADILQKRELAELKLFDFAPLGGALVLAGLAYMMIWGRRMLPRHASRRRKRRDLARVYKLHERLLSVRIPKGSTLIGETLEGSSLGTVLDCQVLAIIRNGKHRLAPSPGEVLCSEDELIIRGKLSSLKGLLRFQGVSVERLNSVDASGLASGLCAVGFRLVEKGVRGWTIRDLKLRQRYRVMVAAVQKGDRYIYRRLGSEPLEEGEVIHVIGTPTQIELLAEDPYFERIESQVEVEEFLTNHLFVATLSEASSLISSSLKESRIGEATGLVVVGIMRGEETLLPAPASEIIQPDDRLLIAGEAGEVLQLGRLAELEIESTDISLPLESSDIGIIEVVLSPRSSLINRTLRELQFREKYGFQVLALWREGKPVRSRVALDTLKFGDALLLQGPRKKMNLLADDPDFVVLSEDIKSAPRRKKAPFALLGLLLMIAMATPGYQPVHVAAFAAAVFVVVAGAITMEEAYKEIEWRIVFLVACMIPVGIAIKDSGAAGMISELLVQSIGPHGPFAVLVVLCLFSSGLSQVLDGTLTVILLAPIAIEAAASMSVDPMSFLMGIALSASVAFLTPFSHKAGLLVMGAGGYQVRDYLKAGTPLTLLSFILLWLLLPFFYPF